MQPFFNVTEKTSASKFSNFVNVKCSLILLNEFSSGQAICFTMSATRSRRFLNCVLITKRRKKLSMMNWYAFYQRKDKNCLTLCCFKLASAACIEEEIFFHKNKKKALCKWCGFFMLTSLMANDAKVAMFHIVTGIHFVETVLEAQSK